jgi:hypothetical protein
VTTGSVPLRVPTRTVKVVEVVPMFDAVVRVKVIALPQGTAWVSEIAKVSPVAVPWGAMAP